MVFSRQLPYFDELDHPRLVDECRSVFDARGVLWRGLVQTAGELGTPAVFLQRGRSGGHFRI